MTTPTFRTALITGVTAVTALAITACSPPGEVDSDLKVDTATGVEAPTAQATTTGTATATTTAAAAAVLPGYIDCLAAPVQEPTSISLDCATYADQLTTIEWDAWDEDEATGTATRTVTAEDGEAETTEDVQVVLSEPVENSQGLAFSQVEVDGELIAL